MGSFSFLKDIFIIFAAHPATSCGAQLENQTNEMFSLVWNASVIDTNEEFPQFYKVYWHE
jgi:hypothetical protein